MNASADAEATVQTFSFSISTVRPRLKSGSFLVSESTREYRMSLRRAQNRVSVVTRDPPMTPTGALDRLEQSLHDACRQFSNAGGKVSTSGRIGLEKSEFGTWESPGMECCPVGALLWRSEVLHASPYAQASRVLNVATTHIVSILVGFEGNAHHETQHSLVRIGQRLRDHVHP